MKSIFWVQENSRELYFLMLPKARQIIMKKAGCGRSILGSSSPTFQGFEELSRFDKGIKIWLPNQVWASDITYRIFSGGFVDLVTIIDQYFQEIRAWQVSNTMDAQFCDRCESHGIRISRTA